LTNEAKRVSTKEAVTYTERGKSTATATAVVSLYQILLGRDPENSFVIEEGKTQPIATLFNSFLESAEFDSFVLRAIAKGKRLRHELNGPGPSKIQRHWIGSLIALTSDQEHKIDAAQTWRQFFDALFDVIGCPQQESAIAADIATVPALEIVGCIEELSATGIKGWALRPEAPERAVEIECFIGPDSVGRAPCNEYRASLDRPTFGNASSGYSLNFEPRLEFPELHNVEFRICDASNRAIICGPISLGGNGNHSPELISILHAKATLLEKQVTELKLMVNSLVDGSSSGRRPEA
jgi:hypothetical protein